MATILDLLVAHPAICVLCLSRDTRVEAAHVLRDLERLGIAPHQGSCDACDEVTAVFRAF